MAEFTGFLHLPEHFLSSFKLSAYVDVPSTIILYSEHALDLLLAITIAILLPHTYTRIFFARRHINNGRRLAGRQSGTTLLQAD